MGRKYVGLGKQVMLVISIDILQVLKQFIQIDLDGHAQNIS